jgi:hypothetical protein
MWPFNKTPAKPPADSYSDYATPEQFMGGSRCAQLTPDERAVVERRLSIFDGQMVHPEYANDMFGVFAASSLAKYAVDIVRDAEGSESAGERTELLGAAVSALQNADTIYPHPTLKSHLAEALEKIGLSADAAKFRSEASREEATRTIKDTDEILRADLTYRL